MRAEDRILKSDDTRTADRKAELLASLVAAPDARPAAGRVLPQAATARLSAICQEIDETVLPRVLHLRAGGQVVGLVTVSHRHVVAVDLPGRPRVRPEADALALQLATRLGEIAATAGELTLSIGRRETAPLGADATCSLAALRAALTLTTTGTAFDRLQELVSARSQAQLVWADPGTPGQFSGQANWATALQDLARAFAAQNLRPASNTRIGRQHAEGWAIPISGQQILIVARLDRRGLAAVMPFAAGLAAITAWQGN